VISRRAFALALLVLGAFAGPTLAHEMRPGFLELRETAPGTYSFLWKKPSGGEIEIYIAPIVPKECRLATSGQQQLTPGALVVRGTLRCEGGLQGRTLAIDGLESTVTDVIVRIHHADGRLESHLLKPVNPSVTLGAQTTGWQRSFSYMRLGIEHILLGVDHLLFVLGLLHGFGFASGLTTMGLPQAEIPLALLLFNVGVEIGQIFFVVMIVLLERAFRTLEIRWPRFAEALPGYAVGSLGAYWTIQRTLVLLGGLRW
jgi:hypothetical protein